MAAKQRIALVANTSWSIYKFRLYLIETLLKKGFAVLILAPRDAYTVQFEDLPGLTFIDLRYMRGKTISPFSDWRLYKELLHHYRTTRPHLIFHYTIKANVYGTMAAHKTRIPSISVVTGLGYAFTGKGWLRPVVKLLYKNTLHKSKETWVLNEDDRRLLIRERLAAEDKIFLLPGEGVDTGTFFPAPFQQDKKEIVFLFVGRMIRHKGIVEFVDASRLLKARGLAIRCELLGGFDDNPAALSRKQIEQWNAEGVVTYLGHTDHVAAIMEKADCIVLPSYREGLPTSLLEGASMCKALIAADTPGCKSLIDDGVNGYLCREKDSEDLARKMEAYYRLPAAQKEKMGAAARKKILENFTREQIAAIYLEKIEAFAYSPVHPV
jgi:glycosyltransferase involved in cell wall biosynthesis